MAEISLVGDQFKYSVDYHRFADYLGVNTDDRQEYDLARKMGLLYDWGIQKTSSGDFNKITQEVSKLQHKLGITYIGKMLVNTLTHWARIDMDNERLKTQQKIEQEKVRLAREKLESRHRRATDLKKEREKEDKFLSQEYEKVKKETSKYIEEHQKSIPKEEKLKVKDIPIQETESTPVNL